MRKTVFPFSYKGKIYSEFGLSFRLTYLLYWACLYIFILVRYVIGVFGPLMVGLISYFEKKKKKDIKAK